MTRTVQGFDVDGLRKLDATTLAQEYAVWRRNADDAAGKSRLALELGSKPMNIPSAQALSQLEQVLAEKGLAAEDLDRAKRREVYIGMPVLALYASLGKPYRENRTVTATGVSIQHVFGAYGPYVYTINGHVVSWQD